MANKITYSDKVGLIAKKIATYQWQDSDANEIKLKHNLNDDRINNLEENQYSGVKVYSTKASLPVTGTLLQSYKVSNDTTISNNGYYHWSGSAYVKDKDLETDYPIEFTPLYTIPYTTTGVIYRFVSPVLFEAGKTYTVKIYFSNTFTSPSSVAFAYKTSSSSVYTDAVDAVLQIDGSATKLYYYQTFTATARGVSQYIYINSTTAVTAYVSIDEISYLPKAFDSKAINSGFPVVDTHYYSTSGVLQRIVSPKTFISGKTYTAKVSFSSTAVVSSGQTIAFALRTLSDSNYANVVDSITIINLAIEKTDYTFEFTATGNATYYYLYFNLETNITCSISFIDETELSNNINSYLYLYEKTKALSGTNKTKNYYGSPVSLIENTFDINEYFTLTKPGGEVNAFQGSSLHNGKLVCCFHTGKCAVYDFANKTAASLAYFSLGSYGASNHANCANFSNVYHLSNPDFPLLYVTGGNDEFTMRCEVENIKITAGVYSSTLVQQITLDQSGFAAAGRETIWGWPAWLVDAKNGYLYTFTSHYRSSLTAYYDDNYYIANKFKLPAVSDGFSITLTIADLVEQFTFPFNTYITQSGMIFNNKIYHVYGYGSTEFPFEIRVYNLLTGSLESSITPGITEEPESCFVSGGKLYTVSVSGVIREFVF